MNGARKDLNKERNKYFLADSIVKKLQARHIREKLMDC